MIPIPRRPFEFQGRTFLEDEHGTDVLPQTWELFEHTCERAPHLRAVVVECERNTIEEVQPLFERVHATWGNRPRT